MSNRWNSRGRRVLAAACLSRFDQEHRGPVAAAFNGRVGLWGVTPFLGMPLHRAESLAGHVRTADHNHARDENQQILSGEKKRFSKAVRRKK
jgi:hypothetical protein